MGRIYDASLEREEAERWYRSAADQGHPTAFREMANRYTSFFRGEYAEATRLYHRAAELGDAEAQYFLENSYRYGDTDLGIPEDDVQSTHWYRHGAAQGHASAQVGLGLSYRDGEGALRDYVLAHMWYNIARSSGADTIDEESLDRLENSMTHEDIIRAVELAHRCMDSGYRDCSPS